MLDRIPELEVLSTHPSIRKALESGNPHKLYRALWWGNLLGKFGHHRELVRSLLASRRLFLKPISSAPGMFTLNGFGVRIYGEAERDPEDGTYIGTHFVTALFLPLFPLRQYLCVSEGKQYQFFGSVPLSSAVYAWRQLAVVTLAAGIVVAAASSWEAASHNDLTVANGLDYPVEVEVAGETVAVDPDEIVSRRLATGHHSVVVRTTTGEVVEEGELELTAGDDVVVWNPLGAAFLYEGDVAYSADGEAEGREPTVFCGESAIRRRRVHYPFQEPPDEISMSSSTDVEHRTTFDLLPGGWRMCAAHLVHNGRAEEGLALATTVGDLDQVGDVYVIHALLRTARSLEDGAAWVDDLIEAGHREVELHRLRQNLYGELGRYDDLRAIYRRWQAEEPDSPDVAYLRIRVEVGEESEALLREAVERWPDHLHLLRARAWRDHRERRFDRALSVWQRLMSEVDPGYSALAAESLLGLDRAEEARALVAAHSPRSLDEAVSLGQLTVAAGGAFDASPIDALDLEPEDVAAYHARVTGELPAGVLDRVEDPAARAAAEVVARLHRDGPAALKLLRSAPEDTVAWLDEASLLVLFGEALREGDGALAEALALAADPSDFSAGAFRVIRGAGTEDDLEDLDLQIRAAVALAASRRPGLSAAERRRLRAAAARDDLSGTVVSHALDSWCS